MSPASTLVPNDVEGGRIVVVVALGDASPLARIDVGVAVEDSVLAAAGDCLGRFRVESPGVRFVVSGVAVSTVFPESPLIINPSFSFLVSGFVSCGLVVDGGGDDLEVEVDGIAVGDLFGCEHRDSSSW